MAVAEPSEDEIRSLFYFALAALSAITIFRRELSPNRRFAEEATSTITTETSHSHLHHYHSHHHSAVVVNVHNNKNNNNSTTPCISNTVNCNHDLDWKEMESVLEGTGLEFGASLRAVWLHVQSFLNSSAVTTPLDVLPRILPPAAGTHNTLLNDHDAVAKKYDLLRMIQAAKEGNDNNNDQWKTLPLDLQLHIMTYLHPRDVLAFVTINSTCLHLKHNPTLWKRLWLRDFGWVMTCWEPGIQARKRAGFADALSLLEFDAYYSAHFYFSFAWTYLALVLASHNTVQSCLVGLGGHVYDLTHFLPAHPGSQETVLVHAGRCATTFYAGIRHSFTAQKLAQKLCVLVDGGSTRKHSPPPHHHHDDFYGVRPTVHTKLLDSPLIGRSNLTRVHPPATTTTTTTTTTTDFSSYNPNNNNNAAVPFHLDRHHSNGDRREDDHHTTSLKRKTTASLQSFTRLRAELAQQEIAAKQAATQAYASLSPLGECHVFFDAFAQQWKAWYTDFDFQSVFVDL